MIYTAKQFSVEQSIKNFIGSILVLLQESGCECGSHAGILDVENTYASLTHGPGGVQTAFIDLQGPVAQWPGDRPLEDSCAKFRCFWPLKFCKKRACRPTTGRQALCRPVRGRQGSISVKF